MTDIWIGSTSISIASSRDRTRALVAGSGCWVEDIAGRRYLDARSNLWNAALGYSNEAVISAVTNQLYRLPIATTLRHDQPAQVTVDYLEQLQSQLRPHMQAFKLYQSGSQTVEGAVLLSRFARLLTGEPERTGIVSLSGSWHGTGVAAGAVTGEPELHMTMGPALPGHTYIDPPVARRHGGSVDVGNSLQAVERHIQMLGPTTITALFVEPIMGTAMNELPSEYLIGLAEICQKHGIYFVVDEISTGFGRTGSWTMSEELGITPSMLLLGKGMSAGITSMSALAIGTELFDLLYSPPNNAGFPHGSTADGHPLAAAAGLAVLAEIDRMQVFRNVRAMGALLTAGLDALATRFAMITDVRGRGLMLGLELADQSGQPLPTAGTHRLRSLCMHSGLLISSTRNVVGIVPPLIITAAEVEQLLERLGVALAAFS